MKTLLKTTYKDKFNIMLVGGHTQFLADSFRCQLHSARIGGVIYVAETLSDGMVGVAFWYGPGQSIMRT